MGKSTSTYKTTTSTQ